MVSPLSWAGIGRVRDSPTSRSRPDTAALSGGRHRPGGRPGAPTAVAAGLVVALLAVGVAFWQQAPDWVAARVHVRPATLVLRPDLEAGAGPILGRLLRGKLKVTGSVWVDNTTWLDIAVRRVRWTAHIRGRAVAAGKLEPGPVLLSDRQDKVEFGATVMLASLGLAAIDILKVGSADVEVEVAMSASVLGLEVERRMRLRDFDLRVDATQIPMDELMRAPVGAATGATAPPTPGGQVDERGNVGIAPGAGVEPVPRTKGGR